MPTRRDPVLPDSDSALAGVLQPSEALLNTAGAAAYIVALAASFPCLAHKVAAGGITAENWDIDHWLKYAAPWSHGEKCAAYFVATVWNYSNAKNKKWKFDAVDAVSVWDSENRAAFFAWASRPVWP